MDELASRPRDQLGLLPILDLPDPDPQLRCGGERRADQVGVAHVVDVRLVGCVQREAETAGHVGLTHPEQRRRHRDVGMDPCQRQRVRDLLGPLRAVTAPAAAHRPRFPAPSRRACGEGRPRRSATASPREGKGGASSAAVRRDSRWRTGSARARPAASGRRGRGCPTPRCRRRLPARARSGLRARRGRRCRRGR